MQRNQSNLTPQEWAERLFPTSTLGVVETLPAGESINMFFKDGIYKVQFDADQSKIFVCFVMEI